MFNVCFRFYAELNDFLSADRRQKSFSHAIQKKATIKDIIESLGVPHPEIDLLLVNGESVDFSYHVLDGDRISAYPYFSYLDIASLSKVRPQPQSQLRFIADVHLGKLVKKLRILGFDVLYRNSYTDAELARQSHRDRRILLTHDRGLLKHARVTYGYYVRSSDPWHQLLEVLHRYRAFDSIQPFQRCLSCNHLTKDVPKAAVYHRLPPFVRANHDDFRLCPDCDRVYWKGTHYERMKQFCADVLKSQFQLTNSAR